MATSFHLDWKRYFERHQWTGGWQIFRYCKTTASLNRNINQQNIKKVQNFILHPKCLAGYIQTVCRQNLSGCWQGVMLQLVSTFYTRPLENSNQLVGRFTIDYQHIECYLWLVKPNISGNEVKASEASDAPKSLTPPHCGGTVCQ